MSRKTSEWEIEFEKTKFAKEGGSCFECCDYEAMYSNLKSFIQTLLLKQRCFQGIVYITPNDSITSPEFTDRESLDAWVKEKLVGKEEVG